MDYPKSVPSVGLVNGKFVDENTVSGAPGSLISASWGNAVTDELLAVIRAAQIDPKEEDLDQLLEAIRYLVQNDAYTKSRVYNKEEIDALLKNNNGVPIGMMVPFPVSAIPAGFLEVDGSLQSISAYPDLGAYLGTRFNQANDPVGYFRLPDSRGEFLRGWDHGRGIDAGRVLGAYQADSLQGFRLESMRAADGRVGNDDVGSGAIGLGFAMSTATSESRPRNLTGAFVTDGVNGTPRVGSETRGRNVAVMWCIKAWNAPTNQGNIDIAALKALAVQATEINLGLARIATQAEVDSGADDATAVTPRKLRKGFAISLAANGYIAFPSWLGGLIFQWGHTTVAGFDLTHTTSFPLRFPSTCLCAIAQASNPAANGYIDSGPQVVSFSSTSLSCYIQNYVGGVEPPYGFYWFGVGY
ncbi:phage tail protein [Pseudomonas capsici]|uniref:phage tail protein n=1 Tax=Pseudomonas capsici TaxID=2810614 RepID=UPI000E3CB5C4|nr:phage tail protein [Pseudomonas capsici]MCV4284350.1 tail fiber protein [Pseudomonas capsici]